MTAVSPLPDATLSCHDAEQGLRALLSLDPLGEDRFISRWHEGNSGGEVFGGQYLGQAVIAAAATVDGVAPQAMTAYFLRGARAGRPLVYEVRRMRDGLQFRHRRVDVFQGDSLVFTAELSFHDAEPDRPEHARPMPPVPAPESLLPMADLLEQLGEAAPLVAIERMRNRPLVQVRPVNDRHGIVQAGPEPAFQIWLQLMSCDTADAPPALAQAMLAYLSDYWSNVAGRITHGPSLFERGARTSSLNHGVWFHRVPDLRDWVLYSLDSPHAGGGTGFNRGLLYSRDGTLLASTVQESLIRLPR